MGNSTQTGCDVICLVYDSSNPRSFEYCARIYLRYFSTTQLPVLVVANKSDKGVVRQDYILQPEAFCAKHKLPPPKKNFVKSNTYKRYFHKTCDNGSFPKSEATCPCYDSEEATRRVVGDNKAFKAARSC